MKKLTLIAAFFLTASLAFCEKITILSYNIAHNSSYKKEHYEEWMEGIGEIVRQNEADIVLLQEVPIAMKKGFVTRFYGDVELHFKLPQKKTILDDIARELGPGWKSISTAFYLLHDGVTIDGTAFSGGDMSQNNAIFYNSQKVSAEDLSDPLGFTIFPECDYRFNKNNVQAARFTSGESTFILVNVHLQSKNSIEKRDRDLLTLADMLLNEFGGEISDEPVIAGGDFNTRRKEFASLDFESYVIDGKSSPKTTLSIRDSGFAYANDYDHFVYNPAMVEKVKTPTVRARIGNAGRNLEKENSIIIAGVECTSSKELRNRLSDHVPIMIVVEF